MSHGDVIVRPHVLRKKAEYIQISYKGDMKEVEQVIMADLTQLEDFLAETDPQYLKDLDISDGLRIDFSVCHLFLLLALNLII